MPATFIKTEALAQVFYCEFCEISKNTSGGCFCVYRIVKCRGETWTKQMSKDCFKNDFSITIYVDPKTMS